MTTSSKEIQVSGVMCFEENQWRDAILHYLFGVWGNQDQVMYRPKLGFYCISLRLDLERCRYWAVWTDRHASLEEPPEISQMKVLTVPSSQLEVEAGLVRFVKDDSILMLVIALENLGQIRLWKKERRGEYGIWGQNLETPKELEGLILS